MCCAHQVLEESSRTPFERMCDCARHPKLWFTQVPVILHPRDKPFLPLHKTVARIRAPPPDLLLNRAQCHELRAKFCIEQRPVSQRAKHPAACGQLKRGLGRSVRSRGCFQVCDGVRDERRVCGDSAPLPALWRPEPEEIDRVSSSMHVMTMGRTR